MKPQPTRWFPTSRAQQLNGLDVSGWDMESPRGEKNEYFAVKAYQSNPWFYADTSVRTERLALTNVLDLLTLARGVIYGNGRPEKTYKENVEIKLQAKCLNASSPWHAISISMELIHLNERMFDDW